MVLMLLSARLKIYTLYDVGTYVLTRTYIFLWLDNFVSNEDECVK